MKNNIRSSITLYIRHQNSVTGVITPVRRVLRNCFITMGDGDTRFRTGSVPDFSMLIQVFQDPFLTFVEPHIWKETPIDELEGLWTFRGTDLAQTFPVIVPYEIEKEIAPSINPTSAEANFIINTPNADRVASADNGMRGSNRVQHILLRI